MREGEKKKIINGVFARNSDGLSTPIEHPPGKLLCRRRAASSVRSELEHAAGRSERRFIRVLGTKGFGLAFHQDVLLPEPNETLIKILTALVTINPDICSVRKSGQGVV